MRDGGISLAVALLYLTREYGGRNVEDREQAGDMQKPLPVKGYTDQSNSTIDEVNANKALEEYTLQRIDKLRDRDADPRWLAIARTNIEQGFMALNRAISKPQRIGGNWMLSGVAPASEVGARERKKPPVDSDYGKAGSGEAVSDAEDELASLRSAAMAHRSYRAYKNWKPATNVLRMDAGELRTMIAEMNNGGTLQAPAAPPVQAPYVQAPIRPEQPYDPNVEGVEGVGGAGRRRPVSNL